MNSLNIARTNAARALLVLALEEASAGRLASARSTVRLVAGTFAAGTVAEVGSALDERHGEAFDVVAGYLEDEGILLEDLPPSERARPAGRLCVRCGELFGCSATCGGFLGERRAQ